MKRNASKDREDNNSVTDKFERKEKFVKGKKHKQSKVSRDIGGSPKYNDVNWYVPSDRLLRDSCSLSYNNPLGNSLRVTEYSDFTMGGTYSDTANLDTAVPGIMAIHSIPSVGYSKDNYSPISLAAKALYARVRKDNAGAKNYDPADLIKYIIALDSAISLFGFASRVYGCMRLYSAYNRYWPKAVIKACNVDFDDLLAHIADFRYYLNAYALKVNSLFMPSTINIVPRHFFMYSGIWKDSDVDKSQLFIHVPDAIYQYDESVTPSRLIPIDVCDRTTTAELKFQDIIDLMNTITNALTASEDIGIISGDLMKAFGSGGAFLLNEVPVDFEVMPVYNEIVLAQIQATKFMGRLERASTYITESVAQDDTLGAILCTPFNTDAYALPNVAHPVNFYFNEVTPEHTMEATRLMAFGVRNVTQGEGGNYVVQNTFDVVGSEFPLYFEVWYNASSNGAPIRLTVAASQAEFVNYYKATSANDSDLLLSALSTFDHCPLVDRIVWNAATGGTSFAQPWAHFDYANYTIVNRPMVRKMHETAFLGLFGIDSLTKNF